MFHRQGHMAGRWIRPLLALLSVSLLLLSACGTSSNPGAPTPITYTYTAFAIPRDLKAVQDALNKILVPKINVTVKLNPIAIGSYAQKEQLAFAAGEKCDIVWTAPWVSGFTYNQGVSNGDFLALDSLLPQDAPDLYHSMPATTWNAAKVNGHIYAVINQQIFVKQFGVEVRKDLADKYGLDLSKVKTYADLEPFMDKVKKGEPGVTPIYSDNTGGGAPFDAETQGWDDLGVGWAAINATDKSLHAFAPVETPEQKAALEMGRKWRQGGYFTKDDMTPEDARAAFKAGKFAMFVDFPAKPGGEYADKATYGYDFVAKSLTNPILTTGGATSTLNAICKHSPHPDAALKFLNVLNTDKVVYNLLAKGIENKHWVWVDKAHQVIGFPNGVTADNSGYNPQTDWMFGDQFNAYYTDEAQVGSWEKTLSLNKNATPSQALGFTFDPTPVKTQLAQLTNVQTQYKALTQGKVDVDSTLPQYIAALKAAGLDQVVAEAQKQLDAWAKTR